MLYNNYLYGLPAYFTEEECDTLIDIAKQTEIKTGQIGNPSESSKKNEGTDDNRIRSSSVCWFTQDMMPAHIEQKIHDAMCLANEDTGWNFDIAYRQAYQYTIYDAPETTKKDRGDFYTWHTDSGPFLYPNGCHRKLSMTVQLSDQDDYEGGHFQWLEPHQQFDKMFTNVSNIDMTDAVKTLSFSAKSIGSVVVFPSFLYHQVTPVLRGTRKSLVCWFSGKPYV